MPQPAPTTQQPEIDRTEDADALNLNTEDGLPPSRQTTRPAQENLSDDDYDRQSENVVINRSPQDEARNAIVARFRHSEPEDERPFNGDMTNPENLYGDLGRPEQDEEPEDVSSIVGEHAEQVPQPTKSTQAKRKLTVRGQTVEMTDDEILAAAQKTLAADSYLDEARELLNEAKGIKKARATSDNQHPGSQEDAQLLEPDDQTGDTQHPEPSFREVIQKIQYGDPEEAAAELERLVDTRATKRVTEDHAKRLFDQDLSRSQNALKKFIADNPDLANDKYAAKAIEQGMYDLYKEDIVKLGMPEDKIPTDSATLANWHRWYRVHGHEVRNTVDLLNSSKQRLETWRGGQRQDNQQTRQRREAPRIQVNVDRDTRRAAIPNQPTRTVTPRRETQPPVTQTRSDVVANMRRARGQT